MRSVLNDIGLPDNKTRVNHSNGSNGDIIITIHKNFSAAVEETKGVAASFRGKDNLETSFNIWNFLKTKVRYQVDPSGVQQIRLPKRFLNDKTGDCKSFSLFTAGILRNLDMPVTFRYASYTSSSTPGHVYVVTKDENGNDIIIDGVWTRFDDEKTPTHKLKNYTMRIETLSGMGDITDNSIGKKEKKKFKIKDLWNKVKGVVIKTNPLYVVGRNAFLGLVKLNVRGFATRLAASIVKDSAKVKQVWETTLGGNFSSLSIAAATGKNKKPIFPPKKLKGIGLDPATITALAAAAPIILIVIQKILKPLGQGSDLQDAEAEAGDALEEEVTEEEIKDLSVKGKPKPFGFAWDVNPLSFDWWVRFAWWSSLIGTGISQQISKLF